MLHLRFGLTLCPFFKAFILDYFLENNEMLKLKITTELFIESKKFGERQWQLMDAPIVEFYFWVESEIFFSLIDSSQF